MAPITRRSALTLALGAAASAGTLPALADTWPSRPIRLIVPFPPGGTTDIIARLVGQKLSEALGQPVVVDNRAGAGGIMGSDNVAKSPPDGYMLLMASSGPIVIVPALQPKLGYDPVRDFAPVSIIGTVPTMLVVNPNVPAKNVAELIALAKARPGKLNFASTGIGATPHLAGELFKSMAGVDIGHIPYKGSAPALTDVMGGQVDMMFEQISAAMPYAQSGKLRALAVGSAKRVAALPDLPTISESGLPGFDVVSWFGIMAPGGTPAPIVARLNAELVKIMHQPEVANRLTSLGAEPSGTSSQAFAQTIESELPRWAAVIRKSGATVN
ncbi:MAG TPA: tripartite tricarboxylate transporter substrate binding protein [Burkholderiaceae bacterium]|jgi:tripartite-type tricarboxylate transporter receptor subunit TctC